MKSILYKSQTKQIAVEEHMYICFIHACMFPILTTCQVELMTSISYNGYERSTKV